MLRILASIAILIVAGCKHDQSSEAGECPKLDAYEFVKDRVVERLVSPGSAVFPPDPSGPLYANSDVIIAKKGDCIFGVSSHVDSQNSLGGLLRTNFSADVKFDRRDGRWSVLELLLAPH